MVRRNVSILCVQETKWVGKKDRIIEPWGYKLWYTGRDRNRNGVGVIINKQLLEDVLEVWRKGDRIWEIFNVISVYAPQVGLDKSSKYQFWEHLDEIVQGIPIREKLFIGGDLNGHVGLVIMGLIVCMEDLVLGKEINQVIRF